MSTNLDIGSRYDADAALSIGDVVAATGVGEATLRAWERRFGFPAPRREPSGHRRYSGEEVELIRAVVRERHRGLSLAMAIERVTAEPSAPSLFAPLRERRPDLLPVAIRKPQMLHLSRAGEQADEERTFDALLSVEPAVVREAAGAAVAIAAGGEPEVAERARDYLDRIPDSSQRSQLRLAGAITARAFGRMP